MSIRLMTLMWDVRFPTQSQLLIALKLADFANDQGDSVYPSRNRLSSDTQSSQSTVKNTLRAFREIGLLHVVREGGHGPKSTTEYAINVRLVKAVIDGDCTIEGSATDLQIAWINKGSIFDPLDDLRGQSDELRGQFGEVKGSKLLTPIHQRTTNIEPTRKSGFGSEVKANGDRITITQKDHPDAIAAWRQFALHRSGNEMRSIVRLIDTHGFAGVPSLMPPSEKLAEKSKRMTGEGDAA
jgi:DNA-binding transcriptional ArsR family regulator